MNSSFSLILPMGGWTERGFMGNPTAYPTKLIWPKFLQTSAFLQDEFQDFLYLCSVPTPLGTYERMDGDTNTAEG